MKNEMFIEDIKTLALISYTNQIKVHILLKNGTWFNGIVKRVESDFCIIDDAKNGVEPVFYVTIKRIEPFTEHKGK